MLVKEREFGSVLEAEANAEAERAGLPTVAALRDEPDWLGGCRR